MQKKWKRERDDGGSMFASIVVIVTGAGLCCFLAVANGSDHGLLFLAPVLVVSILLVTGVVFLRYGRRSGSSLAFWNTAARHHYDDGIAAQYRPRKVDDVHARRPAGTNKPITAEEARDIQVTSARTWVPSKANRGHNGEP